MELALVQLTAGQEKARKQAQFALLQDCLMGGPGAPRYADLAARIGVSEAAVKMTGSRLR